MSNTIALIYCKVVKSNRDGRQSCGKDENLFKSRSVSNAGIQLGVQKAFVIQSTRVSTIQGLCKY